MAEPVIVEAVRTPIGKRGGALSELHPTELLGQTYRELLDRSGAHDDLVEQVVGGCVTQAGEQAANVTRTAWLAAGLPYDTGATTVDAQCGSGQQAAHLVAGLVAGGTIDVGISCGVESMSRVPLGSATQGPGSPYPATWDIDLPTQYEAAERIARKYGVSREAADGLGLLSQERARQAWNNHRFKHETFGVKVPAGDDAFRLVEEDEGVRGTSFEALAALRPVLPGGIHTAGTTSQVSDGAAAILWASKKSATALGMRPRARVVAQALVGSDPSLNLDGAITATRAVLGRAGMSLDDIDLVEVNEAFAAVVLAWTKAFAADMSKVNVNGGALSLGHPVGATGTRLLVSALHELERSDKEFALIAMCGGGGQATGTIIQRL
ncbi:steroid 3-ketoacyl-CoA thiolase [Yinghuangia seranimata]|uniref:steroid 3-ketoacyl-CoA thiolase n=1 Tax=Yinghuangia seranimata TaxID=408067 RepID=UPI00248C370C|nr:steroid 3-ketoacyl-CoA thiolase [Yinghuangia seranimata]MDI2128533.1 steroid 3-ketoacyl-CoA thiolase [Yinghuangia seranimata]